VTAIDRVLTVANTTLEAAKLAFDTAKGIWDDTLQHEKEDQRNKIIDTYNDANFNY
jgi:hypothetical protein